MAQMYPELWTPEQRALMEAASDPDPCKVFEYPFKELGASMAQAEEMQLKPVQHMPYHCSTASWHFPFMHCRALQRQLDQTVLNSVKHTPTNLPLDPSSLHERCSAASNLFVMTSTAEAELLD